MALGLYANLEDVEEDVKFEDYSIEKGEWENDEYEMRPSIDAKFMGGVKDFPEELQEKFQPPLGREFSVKEMKEVADEIEECISKRRIESEDKRERINDVIDWLRYWSNQGTSCSTG